MNEQKDLNLLRSHVDDVNLNCHACSGFATMKLLASRFALAASILNLAASACASALTTAIAANERSCFYAEVDTAGEKIGVCTMLACGLSEHNLIFGLAVLFRSLCFRALFEYSYPSLAYRCNPGDHSILILRSKIPTKRFFLTGSGNVRVITFSLQIPLENMPFVLRTTCRL